MSPHAMAGAALASLTLAIVSAPAAAATAPKLDAKDVCVGGVLDRDRLVSEAAAVAEIDARVALALLEFEAKLDRDNDPANTAAFQKLVSRTPNYANFSSMVAGFLTQLTGDPNIKSEQVLLAPTPPRLACSAQVGGVTSASLLQPSKNKAPFQYLRLRGKPEDLIYSAAADQFSSTSKATVSAGYQGASKGQTVQVVGALGYAFNVGSFGTFVPYAALDHDVTHTKGKETKRTAEIFDLGANLSYETPPMSFGDPPRYGEWILSGRPHYTWNRTDHSQLAGVQLLAIPVVPLPIGGYLNKWIQPGDLACRLSNSCTAPLVQPIFELQAYGAHYTRRGDNAADHDNYLRAGARVGLALEITKQLDLVASEYLFYGLSGPRKSFDLLDASATINLDDQKRLGVTASYRNGRAADTGDRVESWSLGLSARF